MEATARMVDGRKGGGLVRWLSTWLGLVAGWLVAADTAAHAAGYRTANFIVEAPSEALARKIGDAAEQYRDTLLNGLAARCRAGAGRAPSPRRSPQTSGPAEPRASSSTAARCSTGR